MANIIEKVINSGVAALQNQFGSLFGFTKDKDKEIGEKTNISITSTGGIKVKSNEDIISVCEESITNICKDSNICYATSIKRQARSEYALETGQKKQKTLFRMVDSTIKLKNDKNTTIDILPSSVVLTKGPSKITVSAAGITIKGPTVTLDSPNINCTSCPKINGVPLSAIFIRIP